MRHCLPLHRPRRARRVEAQRHHGAASTAVKLVLDTKRQEILKASGHLLVLGGPGAGKTTIALLKAQRRCPSLQPGQEILFLSFSRAAVRQIVNNTKHVLTAAEQRLIQVQTYHSFCLDMLVSFGRMFALDRTRADGGWLATRSSRSSAPSAHLPARRALRWAPFARVMSEGWRREWDSNPTRIL